MKKLVILGVNLSFFFLLLQLAACRSDKLPTAEEVDFCDTIGATYNQAVKAIIDTKCATSGCHNGTQPPALTNFTEVSNQADRIDARALIQQTMPPAAMPQLTNEELDILNCWKGADFPEQ